MEPYLERFKTVREMLDMGDFLQLHPARQIRGVKRRILELCESVHEQENLNEYLPRIDNLIDFAQNANGNAEKEYVRQYVFPVAATNNISGYVVPEKRARIETSQPSTSDTQHDITSASSSGTHDDTYSPPKKRLGRPPKPKAPPKPKPPPKPKAIKAIRGKKNNTATTAEASTADASTSQYIPPPTSSNSVAGSVPQYASTSQYIPPPTSSNGVAGSVPQYASTSQYIPPPTSSNGVAGSVPQYASTSQYIPPPTSSNGVAGSAPQYASTSQYIPPPTSSNGVAGSVPQFSITFDPSVMLPSQYFPPIVNAGQPTAAIDVLTRHKITTGSMYKLVPQTLGALPKNPPPIKINKKALESENTSVPNEAAISNRTVDIVKRITGVQQYQLQPVIAENSNAVIHQQPIFSATPQTEHPNTPPPPPFSNTDNVNTIVEGNMQASNSTVVQENNEVVPEQSGNSVRDDIAANTAQLKVKRKHKNRHLQNDVETERAVSSITIQTDSKKDKSEKVKKLSLKKQSKAVNQDESNHQSTKERVFHEYEEKQKQKKTRWNPSMPISPEVLQYTPTPLHILKQQKNNNHRDSSRSRSRSPHNNTRNISTPSPITTPEKMPNTPGKLIPDLTKTCSSSHANQQNKSMPRLHSLSPSPPPPTPSPPATLPPPPLPSLPPAFPPKNTVENLDESSSSSDSSSSSSTSSSSDVEENEENQPMNLQEGRGGSQVQKSFTIQGRRKNYVKKFNVHAMEYVLKLHKPSANENVYTHYQKVIEDLVKLFKQNTSPCNKIGVVIKNSIKDLLTPIGLSYRDVSQLSADTLWGLIYRVSQSNTEFFLEGEISAHVNVIDLNFGKGYDRNRIYGSVNEYIKKNRGVIPIIAEGTKCLAHAVIVGLELINKTPNVKDIQKDTNRMEEKVEELLDLAGINLEHGGSIVELNIIQDILPSHIQLVVFDDIQTRHIFFKRKMDGVTSHIFLFLHDHHYSTISSICNFFLCSYYCKECFSAYESKVTHRCKTKCRKCFKFPICVPEKNVNIQCVDCGGDFKSQTCYDNHLSNMLTKIKSVCNYYKCCTLCKKTYTLYAGRKHAHTCSETYCSNCRTHVPEGRHHRCYIKKDTKKQPPSEENVMLVYWDAETTQDTRVSENENDGFYHECNLIIAHTQCSVCKNNDTDVPCTRCGGDEGNRVQVFQFDPVAAFLNFLCLPRKIFRKIILLCHNFQGFDSYLLIRHFLTVMNVTPKVLLRGAKVISLEYKKLKFIDSLNFLPLRLSLLPKTLGLDEDLSKGRFPFLFNSFENRNYVGIMPEAKYYDPDQLSVDEREKFYNWYNKKVNENYIFDMQKEILHYCNLDVEILRKAMNRFRDIIIKVGNVDPVTECLTLPHCASLIFRRNHLEENMLAVLPVRGYRMYDTQSKIAIKWLLSLEKTRNIKIQHAANAGEYRTARGGFLVDGYSNINGTETVYELNGCFYHFCECQGELNQSVKYANDPHSNLAMRRSNTERKIAALKNLGYKVEVMKECDFMRQLKANPTLKNYLDGHPLVCETPLVPRDAMMGGRCENFAIYDEITVGENDELNFHDFISLYPAILKYFSMPIHHPIIHLGPNFPDLQLIEGLIKCVILPPRSLFLPLLPLKLNDKLVFVLCRTCGENLTQGECVHENEMDRVLSGTWVIEEIRKALSLGYKITKIIEVWEYQVSKYDKATGTEGVFNSYVNVFLKIKQQASGWPEWANDEASKDKYIQNYFEAEGIMLCRDEIEVNPGLRAIAKLLLNALYGRFAMNLERSQTKIIKDSKDFYDLLTDPNIIVHTVHCINQEYVLVNYETPLELIPQNNTVNVVVACFVTAGARLRLYEQMEMLQRRLKYVDTDSTLSRYNPGDKRIPTGNNLGDMSSELEEGCIISHFVSGGAKHYSYKVIDAKGNNVKTVMKCRGISQNFSNKEIVNFDKLKSMVLEGAPSEVVSIPRKILKNKDFNLVTKPMTKVYRTVNSKRWVKPDSFITFPYGYKSD